jgi:hypothetical protein
MRSTSSELFLKCRENTAEMQRIGEMRVMRRQCEWNRSTPLARLINELTSDLIPPPMQPSVSNDLQDFDIVTTQSCTREMSVRRMCMSNHGGRGKFNLAHVLTSGTVPELLVPADSPARALNEAQIGCAGSCNSAIQESIENAVKDG